MFWMCEIQHHKNTGHLGHLKFEMKCTHEMNQFTVMLLFSNIGLIFFFNIRFFHKVNQSRVLEIKQHRYGGG